MYKYGGIIQLVCNHHTHGNIMQSRFEKQTRIFFQNRYSRMFDRTRYSRVINLIKNVV